MNSDSKALLEASKQLEIDIKMYKDILIGEPKPVRSIWSRGIHKDG